MNKNRFRPAFFGYMYLAVAVVFHFFLPVAVIVDYPYTLCGIPILVLGLVINGQASMLIMKKKTTFVPFEKPSTLIAEGPFRYSRNPIYLSAIIVFLGVAVLLGSLVSFLAPIILFITLEILFIREEEAILEEAFGQEYLAYKQRVRRWV